MTNVETFGGKSGNPQEANSSVDAFPKATPGSDNDDRPSAAGTHVDPIIPPVPTIPGVGGVGTYSGPPSS